MSKKTKSRWPKTLPDYPVNFFKHGKWCVPENWKPWNESGETEYPMNLYPKKIDKIGCGSRCCLVGAVRQAFGLPASPYAGGPLTPKAEKFLEKLVEFAGRPFVDEETTIGRYIAYDNRGGRLQSWASDVFEGGYDANGRWTPPMTAKKAHKLYHQTCEYFGYTEEVG